MKNYRMIEVIGDGTYGTVWKATYIMTGEEVAVKKLKNKIKFWHECVELSEVKALSKLKSHENIIKLKEIIRETNSEVFLIFEYADTNLYEFIEKIKMKQETISESCIKKFMYQISNGLLYIHSNGFFHRDLKPENILLKKEKNGQYNIKIADFGLAKEIPSIYHTGILTDYVCTRWYRAPECILKSTNYSYPMDIWALGCIMVELYTLMPIFPGTSEFDQLNKITNIIGSPKINDWPEGYILIKKLGMKFPIKSGIHLSTLVPNASMDAINFLYNIFNWDPLRRPKIDNLINHSFLRNLTVNNFPNVLNKNKIESSSLNEDNYLYNKTENNYYDEYLNNFNYKVYRDNNNFIPDLNHLSNNHHYNSNLKVKNLPDIDLRNDKNLENKINYQMHDLFQNNYSNNVKFSNQNINSYGYANKISQVEKNYPGIKKNFKADIENQLVGNSVSVNNYHRQNHFTFPQIFQ